VGSQAALEGLGSDVGNDTAVLVLLVLLLLLGGVAVAAAIEGK
jgi:hypothetical protein